MTEGTPKLAERIPQSETAIPERPHKDLAARLRGFGPLGIVAILLVLLSGNAPVGNVVVPLGALLVLLWARLSRTPWRDIGYTRPKSWTLSLVGGIAFGVVSKFVMKAIILPLFGADPINQAYHYLAGNRAMLPAAAWAMIMAGFAEETVFRGYMFERLGKLLGSSRHAKFGIVLLTSIVFGLVHYGTQGLVGVEQATVVGLVLGTIFAATGRIWMIMCAHSAFDLTALAMIYWNLESRVAHFIFK